MDKAVIKLDLKKYMAPTEEDIYNGKDYVKRRNDTALALTSVVSRILLQLMEDIFTMCYNDSTKGEDFKIDNDEQTFGKISELMDYACDDIFEYIKEYSTKCSSSESRIYLLLLYLLSLGRNKMRFEKTLQNYMRRFLYDIEALIAAYKYAGYPLATALVKAKNNYRNIYQQPEVKAAYGVASMKAMYIKSRGIHYDFGTGRATVGLSANGATNVIYLAETTLKMVWMRSEAMDYKESGAAGYYQLRGSNYPCQLCDSEVGFHLGLDGIINDPYPHPHCCCYRIPIYSLDKNIM